MNFLCVPETKIAVESLLSNSGQRFANPSSGDTIPISAVIVDAIANPTSQRLWNPRSPAGGTFRAAIGKVTQAPIAGTFTVGFGSQNSGSLVVGKHYLISAFMAGDVFTNVGAGSNATGVTFTASGTTPTTWTHSSVLIEITTALAYNASTSDLQTALNALHSISVLSPAGVVVTSVAGFYLVTFNATGGQPQLTAYATNLAPTGTIAELGTDLQGDTGINEVQSLRFVQSPAASADLSDAAPAAEGTATTVTVGGGGANAVYQILTYAVSMDGSIQNAPYDGQFSLAIGGVTSGLINFDATAAQVVTALSAMSNIGPGIGDPIVPNVTVSNPAPGVYIIGFQGERANTNLGSMTINADALLVVPFMSGLLALTTAPIQLLFGSAATVQVVFTISYTPVAGAPFEIFRATPTLVQPLIAPGATLPGPIILYWDSVATQAAIDAAIAGLDISDISGLGTMAAQDAAAVAITGGTGGGITFTNCTYDYATIFCGGGGTGGLEVQNAGTGASLAIGVGATIGADAGAQFFILAGKVVNFHNTVDFTGTDGITINLGTTGGTLGTGAFAAAVVGANPSGTIGLAGVNGSATTFLRSDGAPALSQAIVPTWTGAHAWSAAATFNAAVTMSPGSGVVAIAPTVLGNMQNIAIGGSVPAGSQFTSTKIGPAATPGTTINRLKHTTATLVAGTVTVGESTVTTNTRIFATVQSLGTVAAPKAIAVTARVASTSYTLTSSDATDTSVIAILLIEP